MASGGGSNVSTTTGSPSAVANARAFLQIQDEFGSFDHYIWGYVGTEPVQNAWENLREIPGETELSRRISKDLRARGFNFVGPTIMYAYMQAVGMVNDHVTTCFRYRDVSRLR
jgi:DNA-3-methyladenine glycosylase I